MLPSQDKQLALIRVEQFGGDALGVLRDVNRSSALVAIVGINSGLFDLMPAELRAHSEVILALSNGEKLGEFRLDADKPLPGPISFDRQSARLPLHATIRLEQAVLSSWNSEAYWPALAVARDWCTLGILLARSRRMEGPVADPRSRPRSRRIQAVLPADLRPQDRPITDARCCALGPEGTARWCRR